MKKILFSIGFWALFLALAQAQNTKVFQEPSVANGNCYGFDYTCGCNGWCTGCHHAGIDYCGATTDDVVAAGSGRICYLSNNADGTKSATGDNRGLGRTVIIAHKMPDNTNSYTLYAHLNSITAGLAENMYVTKGFVIGKKGASGGGSNGIVHLHFEMKNHCGLGNNPDCTGVGCVGYVTAANLPVTGRGYFNPANYINVTNNPYSDISLNSSLPANIPNYNVSVTTTVNSPFTQNCNVDIRLALYNLNNTYKETVKQYTNRTIAPGNNTITFATSVMLAQSGSYRLQIDYRVPNSTAWVALPTNSGYTNPRTVTLGILNCSGAVTLTPGVAYNGTTSGAVNNVTGYSCNSWAENGPERVHKFTHSGGPITLNLQQTGGADVDAFLLSSCSVTNCLYALDAGIGSPPTNFQSGTYYVVVDGYNGAQGSYSLTVSSGAPVTTPTNVSASDGAYPDRVRITWSGTTGNYFRVYRNTSNNSSTATALGSWQTAQSYDDYSAVAGTTYYYWVRAASNGSGSNPSAYGGPNTGYRASGAPANDNPCGAITITASSTCNSISGSNIGATNTTNPAAPTSCPYSGKDVFFKVQVPASGVVTIRTIAGTLTDAVMAIYYGSCSALQGIVCEDDNTNGNGSAMPVITISGYSPGTWLHIRIWGYGGATGTFSLCALNFSTPSFDEPEAPTEARSGETVEPIAATSATAGVKFAVAPNPSAGHITLNLDLPEPSSVQFYLYDQLGKTVAELIREDAPVDHVIKDIDLSHLPRGAYFIKGIAGGVPVVRRLTLAGN